MDAPILAHLLTALLYAILAVRFWRRATRADPAPAHAGGHRAGWDHAAVLGALALHGWLIYASAVAGPGLRLGVGTAISIIAWLSVLIYFVSSFFERLDALQALVVPIAACAVLLALVLPPARPLPNTELLAFRLHLLISLLAYGFLTIASLHMLLIVVLEKRLHGGDVPAVFAGLPPLLTMEVLLFRLIGIGFVLLTASVASGVFFSEAVFGRPLTVNHKTVFGLLSWAIFAALLGGRRLYGWRGRRAMRWTLTGFLMLVLAYVGSRFVLEVILQRTG